MRIIKKNLKIDKYLKKKKDRKLLIQSIHQIWYINWYINTQNQPTKFRTKNWVEKNDDARGT